MYLKKRFLKKSEAQKWKDLLFMSQDANSTIRSYVVFI